MRVLTVGVSQVMLVEVLSRQQISHEDVETSLGIDKLTLLIDHATVLWYIPDKSACIRSRDRLCKLSAVCVEPCHAVVIRVREINAVISVSIRCLPYSPRCVKLSVKVVKAVDVRVIVIALDVHPLSLPFACRGTVAMDVTITRSRPIGLGKR